MNSTPASLHSTLLLLLPLTAGCGPEETSEPDPTPGVAIRVATFNIWELSREKLDQVDETGRGVHPQLRSAAEIIQRLRPDVLLLNEIDFDYGERANARRFVERYLAFGEGGRKPIDYPHLFFEPVNTGVPIGLDLNNDGDADDPEDCYGFGRYPGQYGMALLSRLPVDSAARTFRLFRWRDMPGNLLPDGEDGRPAWYDQEEIELLRLSSKSHWDVPVIAGDHTLHILATHPTPPTFDGDEDRNGRRNFEEIRLFADYLTGGEAAAYLVDDAGQAGGLADGALAVVLGDLNADSANDKGAYGVPAVAQLLDHPRLQDPAPTGPGGLSEERPYDGRRDERTSAWGRLDYVLPSAGLEVTASGVLWPSPGDPLRPLVDGPERASDHWMVWVDLTIR